MVKDKKGQAEDKRQEVGERKPTRGKYKADS